MSWKEKLIPTIGQNWSAFETYVFSYNSDTDSFLWDSGLQAVAPAVHPYVGPSSWIRISPEDGSIGIGVARQDNHNTAVVGYQTPPSTLKTKSWVPLQQGEFSIKSKNGGYVNVFNDVCFVGHNQTFSSWSDVHFNSWAKDYNFWTGDGTDFVFFGQRDKENEGKTFFRLQSQQSLLEVSTEKDWFSFQYKPWHIKLDKEGKWSVRGRNIDISSTKGITQKSSFWKVQTVRDTKFAGGGKFQAFFPQIELGPAPVHPAVYGDVLVFLLSQLFIWLKTHTHWDSVSQTPNPVNPASIASLVSIESSLTSLLSSTIRLS